MAESTEAKIDPSSPYYLGSRDQQPGNVITRVVLREDNYHQWSRAITLALKSRRKFVFVDGTINKPTDKNKHLDWDTVNSMIVSWLLRSMDPEVASTVPYFDEAKKLWDYLSKRFCVANGPRLQQLRVAINDCKQSKGMSVEDYYNDLMALYDYLSRLKPLHGCNCGLCTCDLAGKLESDREEEKYHQFLIGLDDDLYGVVRSNLLSRVPGPSLDEAYLALTQEERSRRGISTQDEVNAHAFALQMKGSLILVLRHNHPPYFADIFEIDLNELPEKPTVFRGPENPPPPFECVARLKQGGNKLLDIFDWKVCSLAAQTGGCSITPDLCVFPNSGRFEFRIDTPLSGYIFNLRTGAMEKLKPPATPKLSAYLVSLKGDIYSFSDPRLLLDEPDCLPERYCHEKKSWEPLKPFPLSMSGDPYKLMGYAVFDDFILFNMQNSYERQLLAYDCSSGNWHVVTFHNRECYAFHGLGVVVENTLYALRQWYYSILALSITRELNEHGDVVFSCCLRSEFEISDTDHPYFRVDESRGIDHLVHFGDLKFCLVRTGFNNNDYRNQKLNIMVLQLQESQNLATLIHAMDYNLTLVGELPGDAFCVCYCFLLPPDLDPVVSKKEDKSPLSHDIDFAFNIQNVNPALEAETATLPKEEETSWQWEEEEKERR